MEGSTRSHPPPGRVVGPVSDEEWAAMNKEESRQVQSFGAFRVGARRAPAARVLPDPASPDGTPVVRDLGKPGSTPGIVLREKKTKRTLADRTNLGDSLLTTPSALRVAKRSRSHFADGENASNASSGAVVSSVASCTVAWPGREVDWEGQAGAQVSDGRADMRVSQNGRGGAPWAALQSAGRLSRAQDARSGASGRADGHPLGIEAALLPADTAAFEKGQAGAFASARDAFTSLAQQRKAGAPPRHVLELPTRTFLQPSPTVVSFGKVHLGSTATRTLVITNPSLATRHVALDRLPWSRGFSVHCVDADGPGAGEIRTAFQERGVLSVPARGSVSVTLQWQPREIMAVRDVLHLMLEGHRRLSVSLRGEGLPAADGRGPRAPEPAGAMAAARADADRARRESAARLRLAAHHRDLDATFFHRRLWAAKMERAFVPWVNHLITPRQGLDDARDGNALAPLVREALWSAFSRDEACGTALAKAERLVDAGRLRLRPETSLLDDVMLRQRAVDALLSYDPFWLALGMEVVLGREVDLRDGVGGALTQSFLPAADRPAHEAASDAAAQAERRESQGRTALRRIMTLVLLLDVINAAPASPLWSLPPTRPLLFRTGADAKSSSQVLDTALRGSLLNEGDPVRLLAKAGYVLRFTQDPRAEIEWSFPRLAAGLSDGVRLVRLAETLTGTEGLLGKAHVPAAAHLHRAHNAALAMDALAAAGLDITSPVATSAGHVRVRPEDVARGDLERTLGLLWRAFLHFQVSQLADLQALALEASLWSARHRRGLQSMGVELASWRRGDALRSAGCQPLPAPGPHAAQAPAPAHSLPGSGALGAPKAPRPARLSVPQTLLPRPGPSSARSAASAASTPSGGTAASGLLTTRSTGSSKSLRAPRVSGNAGRPARKGAKKAPPAAPPPAAHALNFLQQLRAASEAATGSVDAIVGSELAPAVESQPQLSQPSHAIAPAAAAQAPSFRGRCLPADSATDAATDGDAPALPAPETRFAGRVEPALLRWAQAVCAGHGVPVHDLSVSFADGRALCALLHHYAPSRLPHAHIDMSEALAPPAAATPAAGTSWAEVFLRQGSVRGPGTGDGASAVRHNFRVFWAAVDAMTGARVPHVLSADDVLEYGPDPRAVAMLLCHLAPHLLRCSERERAAFVIGHAWRRGQAARPGAASATLALWQAAAARIQAQWRVHRARRALAASWGRPARALSAVVRMQALVRGALQRAALARLHDVAGTCQARARAWMARRAVAATVVRAGLECCRARKAEVGARRARAAAWLIQLAWRRARGRLAEARAEIEARRREEEERAAAAGRAAMRAAAEAAAAGRIQAAFRGWRARAGLARAHKAASTLQRAWRDFWATRTTRERAAAVIQGAWRKHRHGFSCDARGEPLSRAIDGTPASPANHAPSEDMAGYHAADCHEEIQARGGAGNDNGAGTAVSEARDDLGGLGGYEDDAGDVWEAGMGAAGWEREGAGDGVVEGRDAWDKGAHGRSCVTEERLGSASDALGAAATRLQAAWRGWRVRRILAALRTLEVEAVVGEEGPRRVQGTGREPRVVAVSDWGSPTPLSVDDGSASAADPATPDAVSRAAAHGSGGFVDADHGSHTMDGVADVPSPLSPSPWLAGAADEAAGEVEATVRIEDEVDRLMGAEMGAGVVESSGTLVGVAGAGVATTPAALVESPSASVDASEALRQSRGAPVAAVEASGAGHGAVADAGDTWDGVGVGRGEEEGHGHTADGEGVAEAMAGDGVQAAFPGTHGDSVRHSEDAGPVAVVFASPGSSIAGDVAREVGAGAPVAVNGATCEPEDASEQRGESEGWRGEGGLETGRNGGADAGVGADAGAREGSAMPLPGQASASTVTPTRLPSPLPSPPSAGASVTCLPAAEPAIVTSAGGSPLASLVGDASMMDGTGSLRDSVGPSLAPSQASQPSPHDALPAWARDLASAVAARAVREAIAACATTPGTAEAPVGVEAAAVEVTGSPEAVATPSGSQGGLGQAGATRDSAEPSESSTAEPLSPWLGQDAFLATPAAAVDARQSPFGRGEWSEGAREPSVAPLGIGTPPAETERASLDGDEDHGAVYASHAWLDTAAVASIEAPDSASRTSTPDEASASSALRTGPPVVVQQPPPSPTEAAASPTSLSKHLSALLQTPAAAGVQPSLTAVLQTPAAVGLQTPPGLDMAVAGSVGHGDGLGDGAAGAATPCAEQRRERVDIAGTDGRLYDPASDSAMPLTMVCEMETSAASLGVAASEPEQASAGTSSSAAREEASAPSPEEAAGQRAMAAATVVQRAWRAHRDRGELRAAVDAWRGRRIVAAATIQQAWRSRAVRARLRDAAMAALLRHRGARADAAARIAGVWRRVVARRDHDAATCLQAAAKAVRVRSLLARLMAAACEAACEEVAIDCRAEPGVVAASPPSRDVSQRAPDASAAVTPRPATTPAAVAATSPGEPLDSDAGVLSTGAGHASAVIEGRDDSAVGSGSAERAAQRASEPIGLDLTPPASSHTVGPSSHDKQGQRSAGSGYRSPWLGLSAALLKQGEALSLRMRSLMATLGEATGGDDDDVPGAHCQGQAGEQTTSGDNDDASGDQYQGQAGEQANDIPAGPGVPSPARIDGAVTATGHAAAQSVAVVVVDAGLPADVGGPSGDEGRLLDTGPRTPPPSPSPVSLDRCLDANDASDANRARVSDDHVDPAMADNHASDHSTPMAPSFAPHGPSEGQGAPCVLDSVTVGSMEALQTALSTPGAPVGVVEPCLRLPAELANAGERAVGASAGMGQQGTRQASMTVPEMEPGLLASPTRPSPTGGIQLSRTPPIVAPGSAPCITANALSSLPATPIGGDCAPSTEVAPTAASKVAVLPATTTPGTSAAPVHHAATFGSPLEEEEGADGDVSFDQALLGRPSAGASGAQPVAVFPDLGTPPMGVDGNESPRDGHSVLPGTWGARGTSPRSHGTPARGSDGMAGEGRGVAEGGSQDEAAQARPAWPGFASPHTWSCPSPGGEDEHADRTPKSRTPAGPAPTSCTPTCLAPSGHTTTGPKASWEPTPTAAASRQGTPAVRGPSPGPSRVPGTPEGPLAAEGRVPLARDGSSTSAIATPTQAPPPSTTPLQGPSRPITPTQVLPLSTTMTPALDDGMRARAVTPSPRRVHEEEAGPAMQPTPEPRFAPRNIEGSGASADAAAVTTLGVRDDDAPGPSDLGAEDDPQTVADLAGAAVAALSGAGAAGTRALEDLAGAVQRSARARRVVASGAAADALFRAVRANARVGGSDADRRARRVCLLALTVLARVASDDALASLLLASPESIPATTEAAQLFRFDSDALSAALALLSRLVADPDRARRARGRLRGGDGLGNLRTVCAVLAAMARSREVERQFYAILARSGAGGGDAGPAAEAAAHEARLAEEATTLGAQVQALGAVLEALGAQAPTGGTPLAARSPASPASPASPGPASPLASPEVRSAVRHLADLADRSVARLGAHAQGSAPPAAVPAPPGPVPVRSVAAPATQHRLPEARADQGRRGLMASRLPTFRPTVPSTGDQMSRGARR